MLSKPEEFGGQSCLDRVEFRLRFNVLFNRG